jgi:ParB family chromosome partitioning protein
MQKQALGKGLDAIFSTKNKTEDVANIPINKIFPNKYQPRVVFDDETLKELAESIKQNGLIQPILVCSSPVPGEYELIAGERRLRASKLAGKTDIRAIVMQANQKQKMHLALIENIQRKDLTPIEEAQGYQRLINEYKHTHDEIAAIVNKNRSVITNLLRLLNLPNEVQNMINTGKLSSAHGRTLAGLSDKKQIELFAQKILDNGWSVHELEKNIAVNKEKSKQKTKKVTEIEIENLNNKLQQKFGTKTRIVGSSKKGRVEIFYHTMEDLERIAQMLNINLSD